MNYWTLFEGKTLFEKLWPLLYLRAKLELMSTNCFYYRPAMYRGPSSLSHLFPRSSSLLESVTKLMADIIPSSLLLPMIRGTWLNSPDCINSHGSLGTKGSWLKSSMYGLNTRGLFFSCGNSTVCIWMVAPST